MVEFSSAIDCKLGVVLDEDYVECENNMSSLFLLFQSNTFFCEMQ